MKLSSAISLSTKNLEWDAAQGDYPLDTLLLHQLFEVQAAKTPDATAVVYEDQTLSYQQLDQEADALACRLQAAGVGPGALVALLSERSPEMVIGMLAILKAGGAYLPLDPTHPAQRLQLIIDDAKPAVLLLQNQFRAKLPSELQVPILGLQEKCPAMGRPIPVELSPESLVYVLYTSGSTGKPKGVMTPHRAVCSFLHCIQEAYSLCPEDRFMQRSRCTFDPSIRELFWPLIIGAAVVLAQPGLEADPGYLIELINAQHVSAINLVPSYLALFLEHPKADSCRSLKRVFCVGETLPPGLVARFFATLPGADLYNAYGPTETTGFSIAWRCRPGDELLRTVPIGLPHSNVKLYILDNQMEPVATGVTGEIYIAGVKLALGYLHRPDVTEKTFVPNPFGEGRLYKTGDLARYREDGAIEFHGRIDHQVKLHGLRIELGEIDATLRKHAAVRDCVVVVHEERLVAYVVAAGVSSDDLCQHAQQTLPAHMVPWVVVFLDKLPLTPNGKIDRRGLPEPVIVPRENGQVAPQTALETQLVAIWENVLSRHPIGITDNFFSELGGNSLQAVQIFSQIDQIFGKRLPLATLFGAPTIEKLAQKMSEESGSKNWKPVVAIQLQGKNPPFFGIHGAGGNVLFYRRFSELLGREQPFYALQSEGLNGDPITRTTVETMAAYYLEEIRNVQPHGPYLLGGYSFGGLVSYEIARRLQAAGEEIALLALFDSSHHAQPARVRIRAARYRIQRVLSRGMGYLWLKLNERFHSLTSRWAVKREQNDPASLLDLNLELELELAQGLQRNFTAHWLAALAYRPLPYHGKVTLFRTLKQPPEYEAEPDLCWSDVAQGGVEVHYVPGEHGTIFWDEDILPHFARKVAECIRSCIATDELSPRSSA